MRKNIFIRAFIDGNFGDDLFVKILCKRYPREKFYITGPGKYKIHFSDIQNLEYKVCDRILEKVASKIINYFGCITSCNTAKYLNLLHYSTAKYSQIAELNILISGSYYIEWTDDADYWKYFFKLEEKYYNKKPCIIGINFGPYRTEFYKNFYIRQLKKASYIAVRETDTLEILKECDVTYATDIAFLYDVDEKVSPQISNYILISVVNYSYCNDAYISKMCAIISAALDKELKVVLLAMSRGEKDIKTIRCILERFKNRKSRIVVIEYGKVSTKETVGWLDSAKIVIAGRYHAMIMSWLLHTKVIPVCYSQKMSNVINDINPQSVYYTLQNIDQLDEKEIFGMKYSMPCINDVILEAEKNFLWLDKILQ